MGDPRKQHKQYATPEHPWRKERIESEKIIIKQYGIKRKNEIWKMDSLLRRYLGRAKTIIALRTAQSEIEKQQLLSKLANLGLLPRESKVEDVLNLTLKNVMDRRLQTILVRKNLAKTMMQARQFITHELVAIGTRKITSPSYLVSVEEEPVIRLTKTITISTETKKEVKE